MTTTDSNHTQPVAENTLNREFTADKRNQKWVADITYIATLEGWLYLAAVIDLFTRKVVGWSMSERIDSRLVVDALEMAVSRELPASSQLSGAGLVAHSDRGVRVGGRSNSAGPVRNLVSVPESGLFPNIPFYGD